MLIRFLLSAILLIVAAQESWASKRLALVIANAEYDNLPKLEKVKADGNTIRETLTTDLGFEMNYGENLDRRSMNKKLNELEAKVQSGDLVFIYFAGHAVSLDGANYLLPVDLQTPESGEEKLVIGDGFDAAAMSRRLVAKGARATFTVLDASHNNPLSMGLEKGLDKMDVAKGVFVLFSAGYGKSSLDKVSEADTDPNSVFIRSLTTKLKTPGLTQVDLGRMVQQDVAAATVPTGQAQRPAYEDNLSAPLTLNTGTADNATQTVAAAATAPVKPASSGKIIITPAADNQSAIIEEWKLVKDSGNRAALLGFKAKYGRDPVWGPLVDQALRNLSRPASEVRSKPRKYVAPEPPRIARPARPSRSCWICTTYSYDTERVCLPSRIGNPGQIVPPYIRCRPGRQPKYMNYSAQ